MVKADTKERELLNSLLKRAKTLEEKQKRMRWVATLSNPSRIDISSIKLQETPELFQRVAEKILDSGF